MKNALRALGVLFISSLLTNCTPDQLQPSTTKEIIVQGNWTVNYYYNGQDHTAQYRGLSFHFNGGGTVTATDGTNSYNGTWGTYNDASRKEVLVLHLDTQNLSALDNQWTVSSASTSNIGLNTSSTTTQMILRKN